MFSRLPSKNLKRKSNLKLPHFTFFPLTTSDSRRDNQTAVFGSGTNQREAFHPRASGCGEDKSPGTRLKNGDHDVWPSGPVCFKMRLAIPNRWEKKHRTVTFSYVFCRVCFLDEIPRTFSVTVSLYVNVTVFPHYWRHVWHSSLLGQMERGETGSAGFVTIDECHARTAAETVSLSLKCREARCARTGIQTARREGALKWFLWANGDTQAQPRIHRLTTRGQGERYR